MINAVNICGIPHNIVYAGDLFNADAVHFGQIEYAKCQITLNKDMPKQMTDVTLWHECLHGILLNLGYTELHHDEQFVQALAIALNQLATIEDIGCHGICANDEKKTF